MPFYSFCCERCGDSFELLVTGSETPLCPTCGSAEPRRLPSRTVAANSKLKDIRALARKQAAREGHLSNYSKSEIKGG